jgi:hypothetical protein
MLRNSPGPHRVIRTGDGSGMNGGRTRGFLSHVLAPIRSSRSCGHPFPKY